MRSVRLSFFCSRFLFSRRGAETQRRRVLRPVARQIPGNNDFLESLIAPSGCPLPPPGYYFTTRLLSYTLVFHALPRSVRRIVLATLAGPAQVVGFCL